MSTYVDIVFRADESLPDLCFVEVENDQRISISFGKWVKRDDDYWVLRISKEDMP